MRTWLKKNQDELILATLIMLIAAAAWVVGYVDGIRDERIEKQHGNQDEVRDR